MKNLFTIMLFALFTGMVKNASAQADPTTWNYEVKNKSGNDYQLIFHLLLQPVWHIWSLTPGGDGYEMPPSFTFDNNANVVLKGKIIEKGKPVTVTMKGIDGKITYFAENVDYIQEVTVNGKTKITGTHQYQVCNDNICLPPKNKHFEFDIK